MPCYDSGAIGIIHSVNEAQFLIAQIEFLKTIAIFVICLFLCVAHSIFDYIIGSDSIEMKFANEASLKATFDFQDICCAVWNFILWSVLQRFGTTCRSLSQKAEKFLVLFNFFWNFDKHLSQHFLLSLNWKIIVKLIMSLQKGIIKLPLYICD